MSFQAAFFFSLLFFLVMGVQPTISQSMGQLAKPTFPRLSITVTTTLATPKITHTKTTTVTTYGLPNHFTYQATIPTLITSPITPFSSPNQQNRYIQSHSATSKLIALLFATAAILTIFVIIVALVGRKRYQKKQQKRIEDWVELSAGHGGWEGGNRDLAGLECGTGEKIAVPEAAVLRD